MELAAPRPRKTRKKISGKVELLFFATGVGMRYYLTMAFTLFLGGTSVLPLPLSAEEIDPQFPTMGQYTKLPTILSQAAKPSVMLLLDNSGSMHSLAYKPLVGAYRLGWNGNGRPFCDAPVFINGTQGTDDNGKSYNRNFDPENSYYGLFDPNASYKYRKNKEYFEKCTRGKRCSWSGNFLNWITMRRIDVAKRVLTGGKTLIREGKTLLEAEPVVDRDFYTVYNDSTAVTDLNGKTRHMTPFATNFYVESKKYYNTTTLKFYDFTPPDSTRYRCGKYPAYEIENYGSPLTEKSGKIGTYKVRVKVEPEELPITGVIQDSAADIRYGLTIFDHGSAEPSGGIVRQYVGSTTSDIVEEINTTQPNSWTPLAESLYTITGYFQQNTTVSNIGPRYYNDRDKASYQINNRWDPFYFNEKKSDNLVSCSKGFVILITDGLPTKDSDIPETLQDFDQDGNDDSIDSISSSDFLDDIALYAHTTDLRPGTGEHPLPGFQNLSIYTIFAFGEEPTPPQILIDTAINGGFNDSNNNGRVDPGEVTINPVTGYPKNFFNAKNGQALAEALQNAIGDIKNTTSSGASVSILSSSTDGSGATFQSAYFPSLVDDNEHEVIWAGDVQAMLVDSYGNIREDSWTAGTRGQLDMKDDLIIKTIEDPTTKNVTISLYKDSDGNGVLDTAAENTPVKTGVALQDVAYLWSGGNWLSHLDNDEITSQRASYLSNTGQRYIFTYIDSNNNQQVDKDEVKPFTAEELASVTDKNKNFLGFFLGTNTGEVRNIDNSPQGDIDSDDLKMLINYIRGKEYDSGTAPHLRSRKFEAHKHPGKRATDKNAIWRLGDIISSSPIAVQAPFSGYDTTYNSTSYRQFKRKYSDRRTMIYTGSNDGLFHAFNGGFYQQEYEQPKENGTKKIVNTFWPLCAKDDSTGALTCYDRSEKPKAPELGQEMWAYVPQNLLPHLQWLPRQDYSHIFYNDLPPFIFEAQLWDKTGDPVHVGGWGTLLVGGMRFGGGPIEINTKAFEKKRHKTDEDDTRIMRSAYFVMDITDPELPPVLLDEFTLDKDDHFSFTTVTPSLEYVTRNAQTEERDWFLVFGSGPNTLKGESDKRARLFVRQLSKLPVNAGQTQTASAQKYPHFGQWIAERKTGEKASHLLELKEQNSFISDFHGSDFQVGHPVSSPGAFTTDAIYFGTIAGKYDPTATDSGLWTGKMHRLVVDDPNDISIIAHKPRSWKEKVLYNQKAPVSTKPQVSLDEKENVWVFFGTGRFYQADYDKEDISPKMKLYGIREPMTNSRHGRIPRYTGSPLIAAVPEYRLIDSTNIEVYAGISAKSSRIKNASATDIDGDKRLSFYDLEKTIDTKKSGWFVTLNSRNNEGLFLNGERVIVNPVIRNRMINFNTFIPSTDICDLSSDGYAYNLYYKTGTAYWKPMLTVNKNKKVSVIGKDGKTTEQFLSLSSFRLGGASASSSFHSGAGSQLNQVIRKSNGQLEQVPVNTPGPHKSGRIFWRHEHE